MPALLPGRLRSVGRDGFRLALRPDRQRGQLSAGTQGLDVLPQCDLPAEGPVLRDGNAVMPYLLLLVETDCVAGHVRLELGNVEFSDGKF